MPDTKKVVHYSYVSQDAMVVGYRTWVWPVDHPSELVSNKQVALTSPIVAVHGNGVFETMNTIYKPQITTV